MDIPLIGLGTWNLRGKECQQIAKMALEVGYQHIDTAFSYENHKEIGKAIKGFPREKLFLTTKFLLSLLDEKKIEKSLETICDLALKELKTEYVDLLLIHWPDRNYPLEAILSGMHALAQKEKIRFPGVSNYTQHHLQDAYNAGLVVPFNQVEFHPYLYQKELLSFCRLQGTQLIAYRPFGKGKLLVDEPLFAKIGAEHKKTPAQVVLRWIIQKKIPVVPKASSLAHLEENLHIFDFSLTPEEEGQIDKLHKNLRYCMTEWAEFDY